MTGKRATSITGTGSCQRRKVPLSITSVSTAAVLFLGLISSALLLAPVDSQARNSLNGPIVAEVIRVIDGDTIEVRAYIWIDQHLTTMVRLDGIDTPELRGRCDAERDQARQAKALVSGHLPPGSRVTLHQIATGKYAGRVVARVLNESNQDIGEILLTAGLARAYDGHTRSTWCVS